MMAAMTPGEALDYGSVFIFALTGGLAASRAQLDPVGFLFIATLTAVGGGTMRDVILDRPVFWTIEPANLGLAAAGGALMFLWAPWIASRRRALDWLDALALPVAVTAGVSAAVETGDGPTATIVMGVMTGCLGGLMRDVVCNEVPVALRQGELYVTAALAGAAAGVGALALDASPVVAYALCVAATLALRAGSLLFGWRLPTYRSRPPRP